LIDPLGVIWLPSFAAGWRVAGYKRQSRLPRIFTPNLLLNWRKTMAALGDSREVSYRRSEKSSEIAPFYRPFDGNFCVLLQSVGVSRAR
jgi:hypothetical protein